MLTVYKFTHAQYAEEMYFEGKLRVGTLDYYRGLNSGEQMPWLGNVAHAVGGAVFGNEKFGKGVSPRITPTENMHLSDPLEGVSLRRLDLDAVSKNNVLVYATANRHIFCCSNSFEPETVKRVVRDSGAFSGRPYNACVPINDLKLFLRLTSAALSRHNEWHEDFEVFCGPVHYVNEVAKYKGLEEVSGDPFKKHQSFKTQDEFRIVFDREVPPGAGPVNIEIGLSNYGIGGPKPWSIFGEPVFFDPDKYQ